MNNVMGLNAELYRQLAYVADDESAMRKILNYVKRMATKSEEKEATGEGKAHVIAHIKEGLAELQAIQQGKAKAMSSEDFHAELRRDGYYD